MILHNFFKINVLGNILTHASMGDLFFSLSDLFAPKESECHLARRYIVFIYNLYVSGVVVLGGQSTHFYINVNLGGIDNT